MQYKEDNIRKVIFNQLQSVWGDKSPIAWPNISFDPDVDAKGGYWIRPTIKFSEPVIGEPVVNGSGFRSGAFWVNIFVPLNSGVSTGMSWGSSLSSHFGMKIFDPVIFNMPQITENGQQDSYYSFTFKVEFSTIICF